MSTRPGTIKKEFTVQAARPRDTADPLLHHVENAAMDALADELEKVVRRRRVMSTALRRTIFLVLLLIAWEAGFRLFDWGWKFPSPTQTLQAFYDGLVHGELLAATLASMIRLLVSFALSLAIGTTLGFLFARYRLLDDTLGFWSFRCRRFQVLLGCLLLLYGSVLTNLRLFSLRRLARPGRWRLQAAQESKHSADLPARCTDDGNRQRV